MGSFFGASEVQVEGPIPAALLAREGFFSIDIGPSIPKLFTDAKHLTRFVHSLWSLEGPANGRLDTSGGY